MANPAANLLMMLSAAGALGMASPSIACPDLYQYQTTKLRSSEQIDFCEAFDGKALLVVNTASQCGFTPQFAGLEKLHQQYGDKLAIVGFPSNDFKQEYADAEKIADVCRVNYGVTFTMVEPSQVKGADANPLFKALAERAGAEPAWNFNKYLISADGTQVTHFASRVAPDDAEFLQALEQALP